VLKLGHKFNTCDGTAFACFLVNRWPFTGYFIPHSGDFNSPFTETTQGRVAQVCIFNYLKTINLEAESQS